MWIQFLGGGSYYSNTSSKTEYDSVIRLFCALHRQGYRIIYIAQTMGSGAGGALLSSQEYLRSIKSSTGELYYICMNVDYFAHLQLAHICII